MEELRKKSKRIIILGFVIPTVLIWGIAIPFIIKNGGFFIVMVLIIWLVVTSISIGVPFNRINRKYKTKYVKEIFEKRGLHYNPGLYYGSKEETISEQEFYASLFVDRTHRNRYIAFDCVEGNYHDIPFKSADIKCSYTTSSGDDSDTVTLFLGRFYQIEKGIDPNFVLLIKERGISFNSDLTEIEFESMEANKQYKFYTNDEHQAFYHVRPDTLEDLLKISENLKGGLYLSIVNGKIYAGRTYFIDSFEYSRKSTEESVNKEIDEEFSFIDSVIKCFEK